jgi:hypothetical protein
MELAEMCRILEEIARESKNPNARVSAIRALRRLEEGEEKKEPSENAFDRLDDEHRRLYAVKPRRTGNA